jgi:protein-S-isoprenylcysteine O-methyltransferase Ste14
MLMNDIKNLPILRWFLRDIPPAWMGVSVLIMFALHNYFPVWQMLHDQQRLLGFLPITTSLVLTGAAAKTLARGGTTISPSGQPTALVDNGIFRFTRNPMYLGMALMLLGFALFFGSLTPLCGVVFFVVVVQQRFILQEEQRLHKAFGEVYLHYCQQVRRWI